MGWYQVRNFRQPSRRNLKYRKRRYQCCWDWLILIVLGRLIWLSLLWLVWRWRICLIRVIFSRRLRILILIILGWFRMRKLRSFWMILWALRKLSRISLWRSIKIMMESSARKNSLNCSWKKLKNRKIAQNNDRKPLNLTDLYHIRVLSLAKYP
jgi:hypothetical protein